MAASSAVSAASGRLINGIVRKAKNLSPYLSRISYATPDEVSKQFEEIHGLVGKMTMEEIEFQVPSSYNWQIGGPVRMPASPCLYTEIYDDEDIAVGVFTLKGRGAEIPLHDHPDITGMLKVIFGSVKITSYSWLKPEQEELIKAPPSGFTTELSKLEQRSIRPAAYEGTLTLTPAEGPAIVGPRLGNVHRVQAEGGKAAFFDVLMPRYEPPERDCSYFKVMEPAKNEELAVDSQKSYCNGNFVENLVWLARIPVPKTWWCQEWEYEGPKITIRDESELKGGRFADDEIPK